MEFKVGDFVHVHKAGTRGGMGSLSWEFDGVLVKKEKGVYDVETAAANNHNERVVIHCTKSQLTRRSTLCYENPSKVEKL